MTEKELPEAYVKIIKYEDKREEIVISAHGLTSDEAWELFVKIKKEMKI